MKLFHIVLFFLPSSFLFAQVEWISFNELEAKLEEKPKLVLIDMYTTWCGPCKMLDKNTFQKEEVADYINKHFYGVKFNAEGPDTIYFKGKELDNPNHDPAKKGRNGTHPFAGNFAVNGRLAYPTIALMDEKTNMLIQPIQGYLTPDKIEPILKFFGSGAYKISTWDDFQESFKGSW